MTLVADSSANSLLIRRAFLTGWGVLVSGQSAVFSARHYS